MPDYYYPLNCRLWRDLLCRWCCLISTGLKPCHTRVGGGHLPWAYACNQPYAFVNISNFIIFALSIHCNQSLHSTNSLQPRFYWQNALNLKDAQGLTFVVAWGSACGKCWVSWISYDSLWSQVGNYDAWVFFGCLFLDFFVFSHTDIELRPLDKLKISFNTKLSLDQNRSIWKYFLRCSFTHHQLFQNM